MRNTACIFILTFAPLCACSEMDVALEAEESPLITSNGIRMNGLELAGLSIKGAALGEHALRTLPSSEPFLAWFGENAPASKRFMSYLIRCALSSERTIELAIGDELHTWRGGIGLADAWFDAPASSIEREWVSACLLSLANGNGRSVAVSLRAPHAALSAPSTAEDLLFSDRDGVFFGDLFASTGTQYACFGGSQYSAALLAAWGRDCSITGCGFLTSIGDCEACSRDESGAYASCRVGRRTFARPVEVRAPAFVDFGEYCRDFGECRYRGSADIRDCRTASCEDIGRLTFGGDEGWFTFTSERIGRVFDASGRFTAPTGDYLLAILYANGDTIAQSIDVTVNGSTLRRELAPTGSWESWSRFDVPIRLTRGAPLTFTLSKPAGTRAPSFVQFAIMPAGVN